MTVTADEKLASAADVKLALTSGSKPTLTKEERLALININLAEVLNPEIIENVINEGRDPKIYWGKGDCLHFPCSTPANSFSRNCDNWSVDAASRTGGAQADTL
jgi:hypothetical protein